MVDPDQFLSAVVNVALRIKAAGDAVRWQSQLDVYVFDVRGRIRVKLCGGNLGRSLLAGRRIAEADRHREIALQHGRGRHGRLERGVRYDAPKFLREEEKRLVLVLVVVIRNVDWTAERVTEIVPTQWRHFSHTVDQVYFVRVVDPIVGRISVVAVEFVDGAVELARSSPRRHRDLD